MSNWNPSDSIPYGQTSDADSTAVFVSDSEQAVWSTTPFKGEAKRNPKRCQGGHNTCMGWKAKGTEFCNGHLKSIAVKEEAANG